MLEQMALVVVVVVIVAALAVAYYFHNHSSKKEEQVIDIKEAQKVLWLQRKNIQACMNRMVNVKLKPFRNGYYVIKEKDQEGKTRLVACRSDNSIIEMYFDSGSIFVEQGDIPTMHTFEIKQKGKDVNEKVCVIFLPDDKMLLNVKTSIIKEATNQG